MVRNKFTYQSTSYVIWPEYVLLAKEIMSANSAVVDELEKFTVGEEIVYDDSAMIVGYIMPRVLGASPLYKLMNPSERALLPLEYKDSRFLYHVAMNMARAFYVIHKQHHIMGDTNPTNILVTSDGEVILIDCDSFQIQRNSTEFYAADRRSSSSNTTLEVSTASDLINMAVLIFQLLMQGAHPFAGRNRNSISKSKEMRAQRIFIYDHPAYKPIDGTPSFNCLPESLRSLFVDAFTNQPHNPPSAVDWVKTLKSVSSQLVQCSVDHKLRVTVPSLLRNGFGEEQVFLHDRGDTFTS
jgi:DNA-binding helix-hairpin-helix protein with protein kinase domain